MWLVINIQRSLIDGYFRVISLRHLFFALDEVDSSNPDKTYFAVVMLDDPQPEDTPQGLRCRECTVERTVGVLDAVSAALKHGADPRDHRCALLRWCAKIPMGAVPSIAQAIHERVQEMPDLAMADGFQEACLQAAATANLFFHHGLYPVLAKAPQLQEDLLERLLSEACRHGNRYVAEYLLRTWLLRPTAEDLLQALNRDASIAYAVLSSDPLSRRLVLRPLVPDPEARASPHYGC